MRINFGSKRIWSIALVIFVAHTFLFLLLSPQVYFYNVQNPNSRAWLLSVRALALQVYLWALVAPLILWVGLRFPVTRQKFFARLSLHILFGIISGVIHQVMYSSGLWILGFSTFEGAQKIFFSLGTFFNSISSSFISYAVVASIQQAYLYFKESQERAFRLQQAELEMLKMQLHPHFFFNTLNAVSALIYRSPKEADRMITRLGDLFRVSLRKDKPQEISLKDELDFLQAFLHIHKTLMGKRLRVEWNIEPETHSALVPNLILQPIVENAIQHGIAPLEKGGQIKICAERRHDKLFLQIYNDGHGFASKHNDRAGIGLLNTRARLENLYNGTHKFSIDDAAGGGITVEIEIPFCEKISEAL